jgi:hypothetical protein
MTANWCGCEGGRLVDEVSAYEIDKQDEHIQRSTAVPVDRSDGTRIIAAGYNSGLVGIVPNHSIFSREHLGGHPLYPHVRRLISSLDLNKRADPQACWDL